MGHNITGDYGFEYRSFREFPRLAAKSGACVGRILLEPRWIARTRSGDIVDVFLDDLSPELRENFPALEPSGADLIVRRMKACARALLAAGEYESISLALTPVWELSSAELDETLAFIHRHLPKDREPITREWLVERQADAEDVFDSEELEALIVEIDDPQASFLLCALTWMDWHPEQERMQFRDDPALWELGLDDDPPRFE